MVIDNKKIFLKDLFADSGKEIPVGVDTLSCRSWKPVSIISITVFKFNHILFLISSILYLRFSLLHFSSVLFLLIPHLNIF